MAKKFARMTRTQTNEFGTWHAGVIYEMTPGTEAKFETYAKRGFCEFVGEKELAKQKVEAAKAASDAKAETGKDAKAASDAKDGDGAAE